MGKDNERMNILDKIERREVSPDEGIRLLDQIGRESINPQGKSEKNERMEILAKIEGGKLSAEEGAQKLQDLGSEQSEDVGTRSHTQTGRPNPGLDAEDLEKWKRWWTVPLWVGIGVTILSGMWMNAAFLASGAGLWFFCSWLPLSVGILLILLGSMSRSSRWLHVRIKQSGDDAAKVAISLPIPIRLSAWALRTFGRFVPGMDGTALDEIILALDQKTTENPFYIHLEDDEDGEQVEVFIG